MKLFEATLDQIVCLRDKFPNNQVREWFYIPRDRSIGDRDPEVYCATDRVVGYVQSPRDEIHKPRQNTLTDRLCSDPGVTLKHSTVIPLEESHWGHLLSDEVKAKAERQVK